MSSQTQHPGPINQIPRWREKLMTFLEKRCTGEDDHDGFGEKKPLIERCRKCRQIYRYVVRVVVKNVEFAYQDGLHDGA